MPPLTAHARVLCIGGHDPSGGAGILADAEAVHAAGAFPLTVITALTEQDTCGLHRIHPQPAAQVRDQCRRLIADSAPDAIKIGLIGGTDIALMLAELLAAHPGPPVVLDPVLAAGNGQSVADAGLLEVLRQRLIGHATLITPNLPEARQLANVETPLDCAARLLELGADWTLITGTHDATERVINRLYGAGGRRQMWDWPRLPDDYHGSGCTLASAIAARLALGHCMADAVAEAQDYTWRSLALAFRTGRCQLTPNRLHGLSVTGAEDGARSPTQLPRGERS